MTISDSSKILVIRIVLFVTYVLIGGAIFREIEREEQLREMDRLNDIRMEILRKYNISLSDAKKWSTTFLSTSLGNEGFLEWSYGNSVLFAMVVVTTIGYGNIVPRTNVGRLFCVAYALIGIPGTCLTLRTLGDKMTDKLTFLLIAFERRLLKVSRPKKVQLKVALTTIILTIILILPLVAMVVKVRHDEWSYIECFYFTFVTLSTIGLGDYLPRFRKSADYMFLILIFIGLTFVSSIFCSMNNVIEQYGLTAHIVKLMPGKDAVDSTLEQRLDASDSLMLENKDTNGVKDKRSAKVDPDDSQNELVVVEEISHISCGPTNSDRKSLTKGLTEENKKPVPAISLGVFTC